MSITAIGTGSTIDGATSSSTLRGDSGRSDLIGTQAPPGYAEAWETGDRSMHYAYKEADLRAGPP